jgi:hypothetical protein
MCRFRIGSPTSLNEVYRGVLLGRGDVPCQWSCKQVQLQDLWACLMHDKLIGRFFFSEKTVTGRSYLDMLELYALPQFPPQTCFKQRGTRSNIVWIFVMPPREPTLKFIEKVIYSEKKKLWYFAKSDVYSATRCRCGSMTAGNLRWTTPTQHKSPKWYPNRKWITLTNTPTSLV